jgi:Flp pilus assembly protein TadB
VELVALLLAVLFAIAAAVLILRLLPLERLATRLGARFVDKRSPLEQALALVRESSDAGEPDRRALERLAVELRRTGDPSLATDASRLAWSHDRPRPAGVAPLSDEVQRTISENGR